MNFAVCIFYVVALLASFTTGMDQNFSKHHIDDSGNIIDASGRVRVFHGVNFVRKEPPWYHEELLSSSYAKDLRAWGLNVVRLGTMWSGMEPREGYYDMEYVDKLKQIVTNFRDEGIYVILDMHQDVASKEFMTYDGFPSWLVEKLRQGAERKFPWPLASIENWFCGYITYETGHVFQGLYENRVGAGDAMAKVWGVIASEFKDFDNVLGYNILNEPWAGNVYKDGSLILPAEVGRKNLAPLYEKINTAIRKVDRETLLFWEPPTWSHWGFSSNIQSINKMVINYFRQNSALTWISGISRACGALKLDINQESDGEFCESLKNHKNVSANQVLPATDLADCFQEPEGSSSESGDVAFGSGLNQVPGGDEFRAKSVMSWHYYFPLFLYGTEKYVWWQRDLAHNVFGPTVFGGADKELKKIGGGQFLTEFGICLPDSSRPDYWGTQECEWVMQRADQHGLSWCYWDTSNLGVLWNSEGSAVITAVDILSRPYPMSVPGTQLKYSFDKKTKIFKLEFQSIGDISSPGKVYLPSNIYGENRYFKHSEDLEVRSSDEDSQLLEITVKKDYVTTTNSWLVVGVTSQLPSIRSNSWLDTFLSFIPFLSR